jgi:7,8-dihydropterin-6-yl-methyl-4-(beta-D-ribofuranosyl)aminobenzene 5'-phosphate synthase
MRISILVDNQPGSFIPAEHGLSYLIEFDGKRILFDTGQTDMFMKNAEKMGVNMTNIDVIILSHGHYDHGNGLSYLKGGRLVCHPGCFVRRYHGKDHKFIGLGNSKDELSKKFNLYLSKIPYRISEKIFFLGEIPRVTDFESKSTSFILDDGTPDFVMDDSALALIMEQGLFVITGCGHAGIVNTLEYARKITGIRDLFGITGGFHLKEINRQTKETIDYLEENCVKNIYPSHCTGLAALTAFYNNFGNRQIRAGDILDF